MRHNATQWESKFATHQVGAGIAAYSGGVIYNVFGSYTWAFLLAGGFCGLASSFVLLIKKQPKLSVN